MLPFRRSDEPTEGPVLQQVQSAANTIMTARESLEKFEHEYASELQGLPVEFQRRFAEGRAVLSGIALPDDAEGQKKRVDVNCRRGSVL